MENKKVDKSVWAIGGMTMVGVGVGLALVQTSTLLMVASILTGVGFGLVITAILGSRKI